MVQHASRNAGFFDDVIPDQKRTDPAHIDFIRRKLPLSYDDTGVRCVLGDRVDHATWFPRCRAEPAIFANPSQRGQRTLCYAD